MTAMLENSIYFHFTFLSYAESAVVIIYFTLNMLDGFNIGMQDWIVRDTQGCRKLDNWGLLFIYSCYAQLISL